MNADFSFTCYSFSLPLFLPVCYILFFLSILSPPHQKQCVLWVSSMPYMHTECITLSNTQVPLDVNTLSQLAVLLFYMAYKTRA